MSKPTNFQQREIKFRAWDGEHMIHDIGIRSGMALHLDTGKMHDWPLMQYTGLKDKDGREIYEGDILTHIDCVGVCTVVYGKCEFYAEGFDELGYDLCAECTVIGNIYENPELTKL
jgi:hypothetical protein